jgi:hypothetical protein
MNRFDDAVRDLLSSVPSGPGIDGLRTRVRRRRRRRAVAIVATAGAISFASVGVAASLGHDSSSPRIAVSPTSSTTTTVARRCSEVDTLRRQEAELEAQSKRLYGAMETALAAHATDVGTLDAQRQAVLRELSDVFYRRLRLDAEGACTAANDPSSSSSAPRDCEEPRARDEAYAALDAQRVTLRDQERSVNGQLLGALRANSSDGGVLDAKHQAILRRLADVEQQILAVESGPRVNPPCTP